MDNLDTFKNGASETKKEISFDAWVRVPIGTMVVDSRGSRSQLNERDLIDGPA